MRSQWRRLMARAGTETSHVPNMMCASVAADGGFCHPKQRVKELSRSAQKLP